MNGRFEVDRRARNPRRRFQLVGRGLGWAWPLGLGLLAGCMGGHDMDGHDMGDMSGMASAPPVVETPASPGPFDGQLAEDLDPDPNVVAVALEARVAQVELAPGRTLSMWTYNGQLPGPRIEARVGDTVRIVFKNSLPEPTTIHWHGLRIPSAMDGVTVAQSPVPAGGSFVYEFVVPDAGTFWYHPHLRSDEQVERGLYGPIVVRGDAELASTSDRTVVFDDILVNDDWSLATFGTMSSTMLGRQGNVILANGRAHPIATLSPGGLHRFRFINAANARYFRLAWPGHKLILIGSDGGLLSEPRQVDDVLIVPGARAEVMVLAGDEPGVPIDWVTLSYERGHGTGSLPAAAVFQAACDGSPPVAAPALPARLASIPSLPAATTRRALTLGESMGGGAGMHAGDMGPVFSINGQVFPDIAPLSARLGAVEDWSIENATEMDHPFHLHGFRFQIVTENGAPPDYPAWRDTINIPARQTVTFRVALEGHPGPWMFHCHILEHAERGMMGQLDVANP